MLEHTYSATWFLSKKTAKRFITITQNCVYSKTIRDRALLRDYVTPEGGPRVFQPGCSR
jgi:hypothetical protein